MNGPGRNYTLASVVGVSNTQRYAQAPPRFLKRPSMYLSGLPGGTMGGQGTYATVMMYTVNSTVQHYLASVYARLSHRVGQGVPPVGSRIAIKIENQMDNAFGIGPRGARQHVVDLKGPVREATAQEYVYNSCEQNVCGSSVAPRLYFAGYDKSVGVFVTVMDAVEGTRLRDIIDPPVKLKGRLYRRKRYITAKLFARVEKAFVTLWMLRVFHADAHFKNIIITPDGWPKIIDYGFAVVMPGSVGPRNLSNALSSGFRRRATRFANSIMYHHRHVKFYNPDTKALRVLYGRVFDKQNINAERHLLWGNRLPPDLLSVPTPPPKIIPAVSAVLPRPPQIPRPTSQIPKPVSQIRRPSPSLHIPRPSSQIPRPSSQIPGPSSHILGPNSQIPRPPSVGQFARFDEVDQHFHPVDPDVLTPFVRHSANEILGMRGHKFFESTARKCIGKGLITRNGRRLGRCEENIPKSKYNPGLLKHKGYSRVNPYAVRECPNREFFHVVHDARGREWFKCLSKV